MRRLILVLVMVVGMVGVAAPASQAPTVTVTFSCSPSGAACTEFLRLVSDGLGYQGVGTRLNYVQAQVVKRLYQIAKEQKKQEDTKAASAAAENTFNTSYPEP